MTMELNLKNNPIVIRDESAAFRIASRRGLVVILGEGAYWLVCMADAAKLEAAGYEWAN